METSEDYLHGVEVEDDVLLRKLLVVPDHVQQQLVLAHAPQDLLVDPQRGLVGTVFLPFLLDEALDPASQQMQDVLGVGAMHDQLLGRKSAPHALFELVHEIY